MPSFQGGGATRTDLGGGGEGAEPALPTSAPDSGSGRGGSGAAGSSGGGREAAPPPSLPLPTSNLVYKAKDYWDSRFAEEESYDVSERTHRASPDTTTADCEFSV